MKRSGKHVKPLWRIWGRLLAMWVGCAVLPIVLMVPMLLHANETLSRGVLVGLLFIGSGLAGFGISVPVRRAENRRLSTDEKFGTYGALAGLLLTALGTLGFSALDFSGWSVVSLSAFLIGSFAGTATGLALAPDDGKRAALAGDEWATAPQRSTSEPLLGKP